MLNTVMWLLFSVLACLLATADLGRALLKKERGRTFLLFGSLASVGAAALAGHRMALDWVQKEDWSALMDVLPSMALFSTGTLCLVLVLDLAALLLHSGREREKTS